MVKSKIHNHGYIEDCIKDEDYIFGASPVISPKLQPGGQWDAFLPPYEAQSRMNLETQNCTGYGTLTDLETLMNRLGMPHSDFSERFVGIGAETDPNRGNSPHNVLEWIRKNGVIPEAMLPFDASVTTVKDYYSPKPLWSRFIVEGTRWLRSYKLKHDWVKPPSPHNIKTALEYSPLGVSVVAWKEREGLYFKEDGDEDNHWCCLYGYEDGQFWKVFDSYDGGFKKLEWNYPFGRVKKIHVEINTDPPKVWYRDLLERLFSLFKR